MNTASLLIEIGTEELPPRALQALNLVLEYDPGRAGRDLPPLALVGKGLVFDTGGLNIKPGTIMGEMKFDK